MAFFSKKRTKEDSARERLDDLKQGVEVAFKDMKDLHDEWQVNVDEYNLDLSRTMTPANIVQYKSNREHQFASEMQGILSFRDPKWQVLAQRQGGAEDMSSIIREYLSYKMYHDDIREDVMEDGALDIILTGREFIELGFRELVDRKPGKKPAEEVAVERVNAVAEIPEGADDDILAAISEQLAVELTPAPPPEDDQEKRTPGEPYIQYVDSFDIVIEPGYTSIERCWVGGGWIAKRIVIPIKQAQADKRYKNRDMMKPTKTIKGSPQWNFLSDRKRGDQTPQPGKDFIELWEVWQAPKPNKDEPGRVTVFSKDSKKAHWEGDHPYPELKRFPFYSTAFKRKKGQFWGIPYLKPFLLHIKQYDLMRSIHQDIARMKKPLLAGQEGIHDQVDMDVIAQAPAGSMIRVQSPELLREIVFPGASSELTAEIQLLDNDTNSESGLQPTSTGGFGRSVSATEFAGVNQNLQRDIAAIDKKRGNMLAKVGRDLIKLVQTRLDPEDVIKIAGTDGKEWKQFQVKDIMGEVDLRIGVGMAKPVDNTVRTKQMIDLLGVAAQFPGQVRVNKLLVDIFDLAELPNPNEYVVNQDVREQHLETLGMFISGEPAQAQQGDEHRRHRQDIALVMQMLQQIAEDPEAQQQFSPEQLEAGQMLFQNLQIHDQQHAAFLGEDVPAGGSNAQAGGPSNSNTEGQIMAETRGF